MWDTARTEASGCLRVREQTVELTKAPRAGTYATAVTTFTASLTDPTGRVAWDGDTARTEAHAAPISYAEGSISREFDWSARAAEAPTSVVLMSVERGTGGMRIGVVDATGFPNDGVRYKLGAGIGTWGLGAKGKVWAEGDRIDDCRDDTVFATGNKVALIITPGRHNAKISFFVNGRLAVHAPFSRRGLPDEVCIAVSMSHIGDRVKLVGAKSPWDRGDAADDAAIAAALAADEVARLEAGAAGSGAGSGAGSSSAEATGGGSGGGSGPGAGMAAGTGRDAARTGTGGADGARDAPTTVDAVDDLTCPITCELYRDPVVAADGHTYERTAIEEWLLSHDTSPLTGAALSNRTLTPNTLVRSLCVRGRDKGAT